MKRFLLKLLKGLIYLIVVGFFGGLTYMSVLKQADLPSYEEIIADINVSDQSLLKKAAVISRESAVKIMSLDPETMTISAASGTYVTIGGRYFILTVAHGINPDCDFVRILLDRGLGYEEHYDCENMIEVNIFSDYAIVEVEQISELSPVHISTQRPMNSEWLDSLAPLAPLVYTGYPNDLGRVTVEGKVMGYSPENHIYMHSYGWAGASGSGIFNTDGQLVGHVMAIIVGETAHGMSVLEDIVVVVPLFKVDWSVIAYR